MPRKKQAVMEATGAAFLRALAEAGAEDLEAVEGRIADLECELGSLRTARRVLSAKVKGQPAYLPGHRISRTERNGREEKIYEYLSRSNGPAAAPEIAAAVGLTAAQVGQACKNSDWFERGDDKTWKIAVKR